MILEADMYPGEYQTILKERGLHFKAEQHIKEGSTCKRLRDLLNLTMLKGNLERMEGLDTVEELLKQIKFKKDTKEVLRVVNKKLPVFEKLRTPSVIGTADN